MLIWTRSTMRPPEALLPWNGIGEKSHVSDLTTETIIYIMFVFGIDCLNLYIPVTWTLVLGIIWGNLHHTYSFVWFRESHRKIVSLLDMSWKISCQLHRQMFSKRNWNVGVYYQECTLSGILLFLFSVIVFAWHIAAVVLLMFKYEQYDRCEDFIMRDWKTELEVLPCDASGALLERD